MNKAALYWHKGEKGLAQCELCPHRCAIAEGKRGRCRARGVVNGELTALGYGYISSANLDPIEKKPLYHFHPGADIFSIGGWGCNFGCLFCQNWSISQRTVEESSVYAPESVAARASQGDSIGVAYTYNEPIVGIEYVMDCARLVRKAGRVNVLVTNGYIMPEPAADLIPLMDAMNIDIKSMDEAFYRDQCKGSLAPVLDFARQARRAGCHVEITNLLIPGLNDTEALVASLARWMRDNLGSGVPLHLSAYHPQYKMDVSATDPEDVRRAYETARRDLSYVYQGNVISRSGQDTLCPACGAVLIRRRGYHAEVCGVEGNHCRQCGRAADVILGA